MDILLQILGFIATTLVFVSFLPKKMKLVRLLNLIGSIFFVVYGFGIGAFWTGFMNACLIFVQIYHLAKLKKEENNANNQ